MRRFDPKIIPPAHSNLPYEVVMVQSFDGDLVLHSDHAAELARVEAERDKALEAARVAITQIDVRKLLAEACSIMHTKTLTENALLRAECEAWRAWWDAELPIDLNKPDMYQDVACARQDTDAAGILKGAE